MPSFCRHGRLLQNCRICTKPESGAASTRSAPTRRPARSGTSSTRASTRAGSGMRVRRVQRAADDGYANALVPGLRATLDAERLADELTFSAARLDELAADPPGLYADVARSTDEQDAVWLAFLVAYFCPAEDPDDPFAGIRAAYAGQFEDVPVGHRTSHDPARGLRTIDAFRAWQERNDVQGDAAWSPQRRFARIYERMSLPGLKRSARYDLLVSLGRLGVAELEPGSLMTTDATDPVTIAAKRVFGIGDQMNLERRAGELVAEAGVPLAALDLALFNWAAPEDGRATYGSRVGVCARDERIAQALGVSAGVDRETEPEEPGIA